MLAQGDAVMGEAVATAVEKGGAFAHYKKHF